MGVCLDTGAALSRIGREQAEAYSEMRNVPLIIESSPLETSGSDHRERKALMQQRRKSRKDRIN